MKGKKLTHKEKVNKIEKDSAYRKELCRLLCAHLSNGYSFESFGEISVVPLKKAMNLYPEDFDQGEIENALQLGRDMWETIGRRQATGDCMGNSRTWFYNMAHRYKWSDRINVEAEHKGTIGVNIVSYASTKQPVDSPTTS